MKGARELALLFDTGQYGRLYIVSGAHARGRTFYVYVLPANESAIPNGVNYPPLNNDAVMVFGPISGQLGWTENYGWIHHGKWEDDFWDLAARRRAEIKRVEECAADRDRKTAALAAARELALLSTY